MNDPLLQSMVSIAEAAGEVLLAAYRREGLVVDWKIDRSPVTAADRASHELIDAALRGLGQDWPVLSEEGDIPEWDIRREWPCYWLVDPLDGTREFMEGTGDFAVHIALIEAGLPVMGVVYQPARRRCWSGQPGVGAWRRDGDAAWQSLVTRPVGERLTVLGSRYRPGKNWSAVLARLNEALPVGETRYGGSVKYCHIASGEADVYPCLVPVCEWDTAAPQAVLEGAGGVVRDAAHQPLGYNRKPALQQPHFYAAGDPEWPWQRHLSLS
ncbi:MAG TPA: 3'(2'),5'-bisphosphate nucleotidase CysQ [Pseudomonadales bacterium]|jgi:3'(2'), 5'-bisphosphate nucleotidase